VVLAGPGADILIGGLGADRLTGGEGADIFSFDASDFEDGVVTADFITDFEIGVDQIELTGFGFSGLGGLVFTDVGIGDAIDLGGSGRFIVLEGIASQFLRNADFVFGDFGRKLSLVSTSTRHVLSEAADRFVTSDASDNEVFGLAGIDALIGGEGADILRGGDDDDVLIGGGGDDRLIGGQGADRMTGRDGADVFEFAAGEETGFVAEFISDFEAADSLLLTGFGFSTEDDLAFDTVGTGDVSLSLTDTRFVIFEGITDAQELEGAFTFA